MLTCCKIDERFDWISTVSTNRQPTSVTIIPLSSAYALTPLMLMFVARYGLLTQHSVCLVLDLSS